MQYLIVFLEGFITFISPCLLPMLPIYVSYFAGGREQRSVKTLKNALGFVLGFTIVFVTMGAVAGSIGMLIGKYKTVLDIVTGLIVIFFGLNFLGIFNIKLFKGTKSNTDLKNLGFFSSLAFGVAFSVGWTPCVGAFLGSALALASNKGQSTQGIIMLFLYSLGLGIPFVISALLIDKLKGVFTFVKKNYKAINLICGTLLIIVGIAMMTGLLNRLVTIFM